jgi:retinol dehydrogenase 12
MPSYPERSIAGKQIVITGATNGIGKEIARALARRGADITLLARNEDKAAQVIRELSDEDGATGTLAHVRGDLADLTSVRAAAAEIAERHPKIDTLINNAGIHAFAADRTTDGYERMMGTNHLGPFLLTNLLLAQVHSAAPSRIVVTASEAHRGALGVDVDHLSDPLTHGTVGSIPVYARSKLMNILFTQELAKRLAGTQVTVNSFCPGAVSSGLVRDSRLLTVAARTASASPLIRRPDQGARMGIRLVLDADLADTTGRFFTSTPGLRFLPAVRARTNTALQQQVWDRSAELVGL